MTKEGVRFVADAMLGSLSRKLRALGFDTTYYRSGEDSGIIEEASRSGRVILTADRSLASLASRRGARAVLLPGKNDAARLRALARGARPLGLELRKGDPRCSVCNGELAKVPRSEASREVPASVAARHRLFNACRSCGKMYWKGGHWKKLRSFERLLREAEYATFDRRRRGGGSRGARRPRGPRLR